MATQTKTDYYNMAAVGGLYLNVHRARVKPYQLIMLVYQHIEHVYDT